MPGPGLERPEGPFRPFYFKCPTRPRSWFLAEVINFSLSPTPPTTNFQNCTVSAVHYIFMGFYQRKKSLIVKIRIILKKESVWYQSFLFFCDFLDIIGSNRVKPPNWPAGSVETACFRISFWKHGVWYPYCLVLTASWDSTAPNRPSDRAVWSWFVKRDNKRLFY